MSDSDTYSAKATDFVPDPLDAAFDDFACSELKCSTKEVPRITFIASLPPIQSAINLDGRGDGGRVKLDIPASDVGALLLLQHHYSDKSFRVTIEAMGE